MPRSKKGWHNSPKAGKVHYRSKFERSYYIEMDNDPTVDRYEVETIEIPYTYGNYPRKYFPDLLVYKNNGEGVLIVEIKPTNKLDLPINKAKFEAAKLFCEQNDFTWEIWN
jgi:hypothetical protein